MEQNKVTNNPYKKALGADWNKLPTKLKTHYPDSIVAKKFEGVMEYIWLPMWLKPFSIIIKLIGALVPYTGTNIPFAINTSMDAQGRMLWKRSFVFPKTNYSFESKTEYFKNNLVIEYVRFGLGICLKLETNGDSFSMEQTAYVMKVFNKRLLFPSVFGFGKAYIRETPSNTGYNINFEIIHPFLCKTFSYKGYVVV